jgi:hypothetical protein
MKSTIATKPGQGRFAQRLFATVAGSALLAVTVSGAFGQAANEPYLLGNGGCAGYQRLRRGGPVWRIYDQ